MDDTNILIFLHFYPDGKQQVTSFNYFNLLSQISVFKQFFYVYLQIAVSIRKATEDYAPLAEGGEAHWEVLERILFLYAKLNPGQGYVQGMNEIVGPIYHAFACDPDQKWRGINIFWKNIFLECLY